MRTLTIEDRRIIKRMWAGNYKLVQIAAELGISQCTIYTELKRDKERDGQTGLHFAVTYRLTYAR